MSWLRALLLGLVEFQMIGLAVSIVVGIAATFYFVGHPYRLLGSYIASLPVFILIARQQFKSAGQFMDDFGMTDDESLANRALELQSLNNHYGRSASPPFHQSPRLPTDMLVRGILAVAATLEHAPAIEAFEHRYYDEHPWLA